MSSLRLPLIVNAIGLAATVVLAAAGRSPDKKGAIDSRICADDAEILAYLRKHPAVRKMLGELPETHTVRPKVQYAWSDDEERRFPRLVSLTPLGPDGKPDGDEHHFGTDHRVVPFRLGLRDGTEQIYTVIGRGQRRVVTETPWRKDKIHGVKKAYHRPNGRLHMQVPYENGLRQGVAKTYDLLGRLVKVAPYKDDQAHGKVIEYYPGTEQEKKIVPFRHGEVHGVVLEYYEDGSLKRELPARDDHFHGIEKAYDERGQLVRTRYWLDDEIVDREEYVEATRQ